LSVSLEGAINTVVGTDLGLTKYTPHNLIIIYRFFHVDFTTKCQTLTQKAHDKVCKPISVSVPPLGVNLEGSINAVVGTDIVLTCTSASSNPAASLKWYRNSDILPNNQSSIIGLVQTSPGADNGQVTSQTLTVTPTSSMDGDNYICTAHVQGIAETVESNSRTLNLKCK